MTIKREVEAKAQKLAEAVRGALNEFSKETGMQAGISVDWVTCQQLDQDAPDSLVGCVHVDVGGLSVSS